ncbi:MAG TPA: 3-hydroxyacyl-CoA dehydrogenase NAD-binding domain-containing protein [Solirubrobacteraceae bacterium]|nr:3-hydroxyacyl-CoA dehydrogenase NAD-binding domain-containing protein [Solirubrobacteraceae bacterium]
MLSAIVQRSGRLGAGYVLARARERGENEGRVRRAVAVTRIALLGDGPDAAQIGCEFALGGCAVQLVGFGELAGRHVEDSLRLASLRGLAGPPDLERARSLIAPAAEAEGRLTLIVEALSGPVEGRASVIAPVAALHPEALVVTTGEVAGPTEFGERAGTGERTLAARYGSPPMLVGVVELLAARDTPARLADRVAQLLRAIGKHPVTLRREVPGMISGQLELALLRACRRLVEDGVADAEQIDRVAAEGVARGWAAIGPLGAAALRPADALARLAGASGVDRTEAQAIERLLGDRRGEEAELRRRRDETLGRLKS